MSSPATRVLELAVRPADVVRSLLLRFFGSRLAPLHRARDLRVAVMGVLGVTTSLVLTLVAPFWLLALGPLVFGVPHLLSDLRYLVFREGLHRRLAVVVAVGAPLVAVNFHPSVTVGIFATIGAALVARGSWIRRTVVLVAGAAIYSVARRVGFVADVFYAQAHNLVAVALWFGFARKHAGARWVVVAVFAAAGALLLTVGPALVGRIGAPLGDPPIDLYSLAVTVAPDVSGRFAFAFLLFFAFAQSVHYAIWLRLVPEDAREREAPRPFASSVRALVAEVGLPLVLLTLAVTVFLALWAVRDLAAARLGYLRLALFHGHLELAVVALLFCEGRALGEARNVGKIAQSVPVG